MKKVKDEPVVAANYRFDNLEIVQSVLGHLTDPKAKENYLKRIYRPGNEEIALLLSAYDKDVLEFEVEHALSIQDIAKALRVAKSIVDYYLSNNFHNLLVDKLAKRASPEINSYVLSQLKNDGSQRTLENHITILKKIGTVEEVIKTKEYLLEIQLLDYEYPFTACQTLEELGRYEEAINRYLDFLSTKSCRYGKKARELAKQYAPAKKGMVAEAVGNLGIVNGREELFYECTLFLGMNNWFKLKFKAHVDSIVYENGLLTKKNSKPRQLTKRPCDYYELAEVMCKVGCCDKELDLLITQLEANAETEGMNYFPDIGKQMAQLFYKIKNKEKSLHWFGRVLQFQIEQCHISHATGTMKEAEELYGVDCLLELKLVILEKKGSFKQASKLATKFGLTERAKIYKILQDTL